MFSLQWRHDEHDGVSNHQPHGCLLNRLFRRRSKKTLKLRVTSYAENISIWWRHHVFKSFRHHKHRFLLIRWHYSKWPSTSLNKMVHILRKAFWSVFFHMFVFWEKNDILILKSLGLFIGSNLQWLGVYQVMAWHRQAKCHYLNQCWPRSTAFDSTSRSQCVNLSISTQYIYLSWMKKLTNSAFVSHTPESYTIFFHISYFCETCFLVASVEKHVDFSQTPCI